MTTAQGVPITDYMVLAFHRFHVLARSLVATATPVRIRMEVRIGNPPAGDYYLATRWIPPSRGNGSSRTTEEHRLGAANGRRRGRDEDEGLQDKNSELSS